MDNRDLTNANADLRRLNDLDDYDVADGYPDIRGWEVKTPSGQTLGKVKDLIVSVAEMRVRYVDVEVARDMRGPADDEHGHALLPQLSVVQRFFEAARDALQGMSTAG